VPCASDGLYPRQISPEQLRIDGGGQTCTASGTPSIRIEGVAVMLAVGASAVAAIGVALPDGFAPEPVENAAALPLTKAEQDLRLPSGGGARSSS
jgi:hypothetical protein